MKAKKFKKSGKDYCIMILCALRITDLIYVPIITNILVTFTHHS